MALGGLIILGIFFSIASPHFLKVDNLITVALQTAIIAIIAIGQTYVIITGGIDLSVGSIVAISGIVTSDALVKGIPLPLAILLGLLVGVVCGLLNGVIISKLDIPPFITTLGMMGIARGVALVITEGIPISGLPSAFGVLGGGKLFNLIPYPIIIMIIIGIIMAFVLSKTTLGRYTYAIGSNKEAAHLSGINVKRTTIWVYVICGLMSGIAGILLSSRLISAQPTAGTGYELDAIAAVVIGGASLMGGVGTITGTLIGAFIMGVLRNGLNLLNVSPFWQQIAIGIVIIGAVYLDKIRRR